MIFAIAALAALMLTMANNVALGVIAGLMITLGAGAESDLIGYLVGRYFGLRSYGQIFGYVYGMFMVGIAVGPYLFGVAYDHWGSYRLSFEVAFAGLSVLCTLLLLLPKFPDRRIFETAG